MKNRLQLTVAFLMLTLFSFAQDEQYFISQSYIECEGIELCIEPFEEIGLAEWNILDPNGNPIIIETDSLDRCIYIDILPPGYYIVQVYLYDWDGKLILHSNAAGELLEFIATEFIIEQSEPLNLYSNAFSFCPSSDPSVGCEKVCENTTVTYTVESFNQELISWTVTGADSWININEYEIEVEWGAAGSGQVWAFSNTQNGCFSEAYICVEILDAPEASFETTPQAINDELTICQGQEVYFENTSSGAIYYEWNFGDGGSTTDANPEHTFASAGSYEVELIAKNECLCADTTTLDIIVEPTLSPFIDCVGTICEIDTFTYTSDADCNNFFWTVSSNGTVISGGGSTDNFIAIEWQGGPVGNIELSVSDCTGSYCLSPALVQIPIMSGNAEIIGADNVCKGAAETYTIQDYNATYYNWSITTGQIITGQGTNEVTVIWDAPMNLPAIAQISVDYDNCYLECSGTDVLDVKIVDEFLAAGPIEVCPDAIADYTTIKISGTGKVMSNWSLKNDAGLEVWAFANAESVNIPYPSQTGMYMLTVEAVSPDDYCNDFVEMIVQVVEKPDAPTGINGELAVCPGSSYQYEATSSSADATFTWYINNGGTLEEKTGNPVTINWATTGPYDIGVSQTLYDRLPCESDLFNLTLNAITQVGVVGNDQVCDQEIHSYTADFIENAEYIWEIIPSDMGTITTEPDKNNIEVQWNKSGAAEVRVSLCGFSEKIDVTVNPLPQPVVNHPLELCANESGVVTVSSTFSDYKWYDDNHIEVANIASPSLFPGSYELVVTDDKGCIGNTYFTIEGLPVPNIRISTPDATGICLAINDPFPRLYALDSDYGYTWQWYKDGVAIAGEVGNIYDVTELGTYQVEVTDINGCKNLSNSLVVFDWCDPNGGGTCNGGNCNLDYCINPAGILDFSFTQGTMCNEYNFTNTSIDYEVGSLRWNFGDEAVGSDVSTLENPSYVFTNAGFYHVLLIGRVLDGNNLGDYCDIWRSKVVTVPAAARFDIDRSCPGVEMKFYDLSTFIPGEDILSWTWDFGDVASGLDNTSSLQEPTHIYNSVGTYTVTLEIATATCISRYTQDVTVHPKPEITIPQPDVNCANTAIRFEGQTASPNVVKWTWDFGDPGSGDQNQAFVPLAYHTYENAGSYIATLIATNIYGCDDVFTVNIDIEPNDLAGQITSDNVNPMCEGETAVLSAPAGGVSWEWTTGEITETISVTDADVYGVTVTDADGCTYSPDFYEQGLLAKPVSTIRGIDVNEYGQAMMYHYNNLSVCEGDDVFLEVIEVANYSYQWSSGESSSDLEFSLERGNLLAVGTYNYTVELTDQTTGCTNVIGPFTVEVHPVPAAITISSNPTGYLCAGVSSDVTVTNVDPTLDYYWNTGEVGSTITVEMAGDYFVVGVNEHGCKTESNTITINKGPDIGLVPDGCLEQCNPDTLCLPQIPNIDTYQWYYNGAAIPSPEGTTPDFIAEQSGSYYVELTDVFGCTAISENFSLELLDPMGNLNGLVYFDVNKNGVVDTGDTLMENVQILIDGTSGYTDSLFTDVAGVGDFIGVPSEDYQVTIDLSTLPSGTLLYDDILMISLEGCEAQEDFVFLVYEDCVVANEEKNLEFCSGTNIYEGISFANDTSFVLTYTSVDNCDSLVTVNATVYDEITFDLATDKICYNETDGQVNLENLQGGKGALQYSMDGINYTSTPSFQNLPADNYTIYVKDELGCEIIKMIEVEEFPEMIENVSLEFCDGYNVYEGIDIRRDTSFAIVLSSVTGCDSTVNIAAIVHDPISFDLIATEACWNDASGEILLDNATGGKGDFQYSIDGLSYTTVPNWSDLVADIYTVEVVDELGCTHTQQIEVEQIEEITYNVIIPELACDETEDLIIIDQLSANVDITWEDGTIIDELTVTEPGGYLLTLSNSCETKEVVIDVAAEELDENGIYIPNIFSPNNDGSNDAFKVFKAPEAEFINSTLEIYDRWGNKVYESDDLSKEWKGPMGKNKLQSAVYVYQLRTTLEYCHRSDEIVKDGNITLVK